MMIDDLEYLIYTDHIVYENKLPALPPTLSPSQSSITTMTTSDSSNGAESIYTEEDTLSKESQDISQDSAAYILAQIERQNVLLEKDPKSICIQSNKLKAHFATMQQLVQDNMEDEEFWDAVIQDSEQVASRLPHLLALKLRSGIPSRARGVMWQAMSKSASLNLETVYEQLCKEKSPHERIIKRDLSRTFPNIDMFKQEHGDGQSAMKRILESYSLYDTDVGYCQGLAFLVGPLLLNMSETQSFCVFVRLMETYGLRSMFTLNMEGLQLRLFQFSQLLKEILPNLARHLDEHGIHAAMYASQWFLTLFAYVFPMELIHRIYDIVFAEGATETIMRVAIAMLKRSEQHILSNTTEFEDILDFLTSRKLCDPYVDNFNNVIHDAMTLADVITKRKLEKLTGDYNGVPPIRFGFWRRRRHETMRRSASIGPATPPKAPPPKKRWSSVSSTPRDWSSNNNNTVLKELAELKRVHKRTLEVLEEVQCDKQDLECERGALKLTIAELERCSPARSFSDLGVAECGQGRDAAVNMVSVTMELEQQCYALRQEVKHSNSEVDRLNNVLEESVLSMKTEMEDVLNEKKKIEQANQDLKLENEKLHQEIAKMKIAFVYAFESNKQAPVSGRRRHSMISIPTAVNIPPTQFKEIKHLNSKKKKSTLYGRVLNAFGKPSSIVDNIS